MSALALRLTAREETFADDAMMSLSRLRDEFRCSENHHSADLIEDAIATVQAACRENSK